MPGVLDTKTSGSKTEGTFFPNTDRPRLCVDSQHNFFVINSAKVKLNEMRSLDVRHNIARIILAVFN